MCHGCTYDHMEKELVGSRNTQSAQIAKNQDEPNNMYCLNTKCPSRHHFGR